MNRIVFFSAALLISICSFMSCDKPSEEVSPTIDGHHLNLELEEGPLAVSIAKPLDKSSALAAKSQEDRSREVDLIAFHSAAGSVHLASPSSEAILRYAPEIRGWAKRNTTAIRKTDLTPEEARSMRENEAAGQMLEAFERGSAYEDGLMTADLEEGQVYAILFDNGEVGLVSITICIGVMTANGNCIGIYIHREKKE